MKTTKDRIRKQEERVQKLTDPVLDCIERLKLALEALHVSSRSKLAAIDATEKALAFLGQAVLDLQDLRRARRAS